MREDARLSRASYDRWQNALHVIAAELTKRGYLTIVGPSTWEARDCLLSVDQTLFTPASVLRDIATELGLADVLPHLYQDMAEACLLVRGGFKGEVGVY
jgi:hypothetical protein